MTSSTTRTKRYVTTEDGGRQNIFSIEPPIEVIDQEGNYWQRAELTNGRLAMIGFFAAIFNYTGFGWVIPGIVQSAQGLFKFYPFNLRTMKENAELQNGRWAMIGIIAGLGAYLTTGQLIPGVF